MKSLSKISFLSLLMATQLITASATEEERTKQIHDIIKQSTDDAKKAAPIIASETYSGRETRKQMASLMTSVFMARLVPEASRSDDFLKVTKENQATLDSLLAHSLMRSPTIQPGQRSEGSTRKPSSTQAGSSKR